METGVRKRHSPGCGHWKKKRCDCNAGYEAWVYVAREGGKVSRTFKSKDEAALWRAEAMVSANRGSLQLASRDPRSLAGALTEFLEDMREGKVRPRNRERYKPATIRNYNQHLRRRIGPTPLGSMMVTEIGRPDVQDFVDELLGEGLGPSTVNNILNPIQAFYRRAHNREEVAFNPTERIEVPDPGNRRPKRIASREEAAALLGPLRPYERAVWATAFYAGLRRGELQALRYCDIDFAGSAIRVEHGWDQYEGLISPKSESGRRTVPLFATLRELLDDHISITGRSGKDFVFGRTPLSPFVSSSINNHAQECWEAVGLRSIGLHECRHTFASLLIDAGANPKAVQTFVGHSKIQTTFDVYGHLFPGSRDEVRHLMDRYLENGSGKGGAQASGDWGISGAWPEPENSDDDSVQPQ